MTSNPYRLRAGLGGLLAAAVLTLAPTAADAAAAHNAAAGPDSAAAHTSAAPASNVRDVCGPVKPGFARCFAELRTDVHGGTGVRGLAAKAATGHATALPTGLSPADLQSAYKLPTNGGADQTVAIVDAGDDATAEADLAVYRSTYGLPACTTANGCFRKVNQSGAAAPLPRDQGWGVEIALDLDMVSAACAQCHILLVEANSSSSPDLAASVDEAAALGATEISNSYGFTESGAVVQFAKSYSHPGVAVLASSGDDGYGVPQVPAAYPTVIAVGGTSLTKAANARGWTESALSRAGSGCSAWFDKPAWQTDPNCPGRMVSDVSADGDPATAPAIYGTTDGLDGWGRVGGTSVSTPFIAGVIGLGGHPAKFPNASALYTPAAAAGLNDVVTGSNVVKLDCGGDYQCTAVPGYDGPTGLGTPNGISAF